MRPGAHSDLISWMSLGQYPLFNVILIVTLVNLALAGFLVTFSIENAMYILGITLHFITVCRGPQFGGHTFLFQRPVSALEFCFKLKLDIMVQLSWLQRNPFSITRHDQNYCLHL